MGGDDSKVKQPKAWFREHSPQASIRNSTQENMLQQLPGPNGSKEKLEIIALIGTVIVGIVSNFFVYEQIRQSKNLSQDEKIQNYELEAREIYAEYLKLALENPDLAYGPEYSAKNSSLTGSAEVSLKVRYDWYVSFAFTAFERIAQMPGRSSGWTCVIAQQLTYHYDIVQENIKNGEFDWSYNDELNEIAQRIIDPKTQEGSVSEVDAAHKCPYLKEP
jgi:hypothetical protein